MINSKRNSLKGSNRYNVMATPYGERNGNAVRIKKNASEIRGVLWKLLGSNQRPPACKAGALNQLS